MTHWAANYTELLVENGSQGLVELDSAFRITHCNGQAAKMFGARTSGDLLGKSLHHSEGKGGIRISPAFNSPHDAAPQSGRYTASTEYGLAFPIDLRFLPAPPQESGELKWLLFATDLTARVVVEREALQAEKLAAMDNVVAGIAHELNNPMTAILGYAELLLSSEKDPRRKQRAALIAEEADRCAKIIANMLTFSRSYGKKLEWTNVNALLEEVVSLRAYQMRVDHAKIHVSYDSKVPLILVQPEAFRRLFLNLVHNAHQALLEVAATRRNLWVKSTLGDGSVSFQISDDGPGISEEVRYKIFDPFFSTRPFGEGMGLGLSVAYGIAREHKGKLWMEPRDGGGTTMLLELPLTPPSA